jgi:hypothetical protein
MNMFGARGRAVNPDSMRQKMLACKELGLVLDKESGLCRESKRSAKRSDGPTQKDMIAMCKSRGLVFDRETKECRESRRGAGLVEARVAMAQKRALAGPTQKDKMMMCREQGLVFDPALDGCRESKKGLKGLERSFARGSLFFGARGRVVDPSSMRQLMLACKEKGLVLDKDTKMCRESKKGAKRSAGPTLAELRAACKSQGLVLDMDTKACRESRRGAGLVEARVAAAQKRAMSFEKTQKEMMAECKAQGLVFDRETKQCRPSKKGLSGLERAYARGSLFNFGVMQPAFAQRPGQVMASTGARTVLVDPVDMPTKEEFAKMIKQAQEAAKALRQAKKDAKPAKK